MTTQQFASEFLPSMSDCRRGFDRVELGLEIALGFSVLTLLVVLFSGI
ncbi:hypothetical protein N825_15930 [Skermanella stibiiresistens SB22]|uniref:Uncharacterized protein n=1 Tax=Skermanella stibiiresistens SB22 TaxID=1385369 RepID=W9GVF9_9PROT|nr:hypothetical protein [Skermanella stibiiresistens]EWY37890.1 hypothetical protein N825_15930 [Skermanella stibiiresistens SB22]